MLSFIWIFTAAAAQAQLPTGSVQEPRITVEGYGSVKTTPDVSTIGFDVRGEGRSSDQAVAALAATSAAVQRSLRTMDPGVELHSRSVRVQAIRGN